MTMGLISAKVRIDLSGLKKYDRIVSADLRGSGNGPVRKAIKQWAVRYRGFVRTRFNKFSRGGGNWPPLKTKRKRGSLDAASILRDTGTLFAALQPVFASKPGQLEQKISFGVRVGFGGPGKHPKGKATIADIASFHHRGAGYLPKREIIVPPNQSTLDGMRRDMEHGLAEVSRQTDDVH